MKAAGAEPLASSRSEARARRTKCGMTTVASAHEISSLVELNDGAVRACGGDVVVFVIDDEDDDDDDDDDDESAGIAVLTRNAARCGPLLPTSPPNDKTVARLDDVTTPPAEARPPSCPPPCSASAAAREGSACPCSVMWTMKRKKAIRAECANCASDDEMSKRRLAAQRHDERTSATATRRCERSEERKTYMREMQVGHFAFPDLQLNLHTQESANSTTQTTRARTVG